MSVSPGPHIHSPVAWCRREGTATSTEELSLVLAHHFAGMSLQEVTPVLRAISQLEPRRSQGPKPLLLLDPRVFSPSGP